MKIIDIIKDKAVLKTKKEYESELKECRDEMSKIFVSEYKTVPAVEPTYIVEMSPKELQLIHYYLELDNRKQIISKIESQANENKNRDQKGRFTKNDSIK